MSDKLEISPKCTVKECNKFSSLLAKRGTFGGKNTYMKTCCRHSYVDIKRTK